MGLPTVPGWLTRGGHDFFWQVSFNLVIFDVFGVFFFLRVLEVLCLVLLGKKTFFERSRASSA